MAEGDIDVMISLHCSSMADSANKLKSYLESRGMVVWVCMEMSGGDSYRDSIVDAIDRAEVVVIMLNDQWALSGECQDEYNYAKRLNLTSYESGRSERGKPRLPVFCPIAFKNLNWNAHKHVRLLSANTNFIVHGGDDLCSDAAMAQKTFEAVATTLMAAGKVLTQPTADNVPQTGAAAPASTSSQVSNEISELKAGLKALTLRVKALESNPSGPIYSPPTPAPAPPAAAGTAITGTVQLGRNYLGNTLSEIRLYSNVKKEMVTGLQAYYSITFSNLVHNVGTGEVTFDAQRRREGMEWGECEHLNLTQEERDELGGQFRESFKGNGSGKFNKTQRRLIATVGDWTPNKPGYTWGNETFVLAAVTEGEIVGFCAGNSTLVMKEY